MAEKKLRGMRLRSKLALSYVLIAALALGACFLALTHAANTYQARQAENVFSAATGDVVRRVESGVKEMEQILYLLTDDRSLCRIFNADYISNYEKTLDILNILDPVVALLHGQSKAFIDFEVCTKGNIAGARANFYAMDAELPALMLERMACDVAPLWMVEPMGAQYPRQMLSVSRKSIYTRPLAESATVTVFVDLMYLMEGVLPDYDMPLSARVYDASGTAFFSVGECGETGRHILRASHVLPGCGWTMEINMDVSDMMLRVPDILLSPLYIMLGALVVLIIISIVMARTFSSRIHRLREQLSQVVPSQFNVDISSDSRDEVGEITNCIGEMITQARKVLLEGYQNRIARREAQIIALQAQINPHFLFNTLSNLNWRVVEQGDMEMSGILTSLSKFYYVALNNGKKMSSVRGEINHIDIYLHLQFAIRKERFVVEKDIDPDTLECVMPGVILQPLVENAIEHGIGAVGFDKGLLRVTAAFAGEDVVITIADNGPGMEEELLADFSKATGYGIRNVDKRLRLYYGENYGLRFDQTPGGGATAIVRIPREI